MADAPKRTWVVRIWNAERCHLNHTEASLNLKKTVGVSRLNNARKQSEQNDARILVELG
jgi:hypothetical protein